MVISRACRKLTFLWAIILSNFVVVTAFQVSHSSRIQHPSVKATFAAAPTSSGDTSDITKPLTATAPGQFQGTSTEKILDQALCSNSTAAKLLLDEISELRNNGKAEELDLFLNQLLYLADGAVVNGDSNGLPWWTRVRILGRFSRRARRASLHRVLNFSTPSAEDGVEGDDSNSKSRRRSRALVLVLRSLATTTSSEGDEGSSDQEGGDVPSSSEGGGRIAIRNIERAARKDGKSTATYRDMSSRVPPGLETPKFTVVVQRKGYDVRDYDAFTICSVPVAKPRPDSAATDQPISNPQLSGASSFGALAGYLFGKNDVSTSMKMTTPVLMVGDGKDREMSFVLPSTYWDEKGLDNAPKPLEGSLVSLKRDSGGNRAVLMFGGFASKDDVKAKSADLLTGLESDKEWGATESASVTLAQYNDPFTPPWKRRNEVSVPVVARKEE